MAYTKQTWHDSPATDTPVSAARLGHIEDGIAAAATAADNAASSISSITPASIGAAAVTAVYDKATADSTFAKLAGAAFTGPISVSGLLTASAGVEGPVAVRIVTASTTLTAKDQILLINAAGGNVIITVPTAASGAFAWLLWRTDSSSNTVSVVRSGTDSGTGPTVLSGTGAALSVVSDGTSKVHLSAGGTDGAATEVRTVTANTTLADSDEVLFVNTTGGPVTVTVPAASSGEKGWTIVNIGSGVVTVAKTGTDTLVGTTTLAAGMMMAVIADGVSTIRLLQPVASGTSTVNWTDVQGKPSTFAPSAHAASHGTGQSDAIAPASIGAAPTVHTHAAADILDPTNLALNNFGSAKTLVWSRANRNQAGILDQAACAITLTAIPDGGWMHIRFATGVSNCTVTWAQSITGVTKIVYMTGGVAPSMPTAALQYASVYVERLADTLYIHQTGKSA